MDSRFIGRLVLRNLGLKNMFYFNHWVIFERYPRNHNPLSFLDNHVHMKPLKSKSKKRKTKCQTNLN